MAKPKWERIAEGAIQITWDTVMDLSVHFRIMQMDARIRENPFPGWEENVPAWHTLTLYIDPVLFTDTIQSLLLKYPDSMDHISFTGRQVRIPVCYDPLLSPDQQEAASLLNLSPEALIQLHHSNGYRVFMLGFLPGFPYMGILPEALVLPRKANPSLSVPAGSVAITGRQTGIYPVDSPGGWYVIGRTPLSMFPNHKPLLFPGDEVWFVPIDRREFEKLSKEPGLWRFM
jgi:KipI family sensor histidine kinase inhibitor